MSKWKANHGDTGIEVTINEGKVRCQGHASADMDRFLAGKGVDLESATVSEVEKAVMAWPLGAEKSKESGSKKKDSD